MNIQSEEMVSAQYSRSPDEGERDSNRYTNPTVAALLQQRSSNYAQAIPAQQDPMSVYQNTNWIDSEELQREHQAASSRQRESQYIDLPTTKKPRSAFDNVSSNHYQDVPFELIPKPSH